ncbi:unnamed protein product [Mortierella alpina]
MVLSGRSSVEGARRWVGMVTACISQPGYHTLQHPRNQKKAVLDFSASVYCNAFTFFSLQFTSTQVQTPPLPGPDSHSTLRQTTIIIPTAALVSSSSAHRHSFV